MSAVFLGQFFEELAGQAGIEVSDDLKKVFQSADFKGSIPEDLATNLKAKLIGRDAVIHDKDIKNTLFGQAFGTYDTRMRQAAKNELGLTDDEYAEVRGSKDKSAIDVLPALLLKAKQKGFTEAESLTGLNADEIRKKVKGETEAEFKARMEANAKTIRELQESISGFDQKEKQIVQEWESKFNGYKVENSLSQKIQSLPWKKELGGLQKDIQNLMTKKLADAYVWKELDGELAPFRKDDPSARAMDGAKLLKAEDVIMPFMKEYLDMNPSGKPTGKPGTPAPPSRGNNEPPKRKLPSFL